MSIAFAAADRAVAADKPIRVMVVDDSVVARSLVARWVDGEPDMTVAASLRTGREAVDRIEGSDADVVVLDIEMPELDGISALPLLLKKKRDLMVIMASAITRRGAEVSLRALALGAADYIPKPATTREATTSTEFRRELIEKIRNLGRRRRLLLRQPMPVPAPAEARLPRHTLVPLPSRDSLPGKHEAPPLTLRPFSPIMPRALLIGSSTGGPQALTALIEKLPAAIDRAPVLITQHMPPTFTTVLAEHLSRVGGRGSHEAEHGEPVQFLQTVGRSAVLLGGGGVGRERAGAGSHRHGHRWHPRRRRYRGRRRQRHGAGRSDQRGLGHAALGRAGRIVLGGAAAQRDCTKDTSIICGGPRVTPLDYDYLRRCLKERSGLVLSAEKQYLVESRLLPVARKAGLTGLGDLVRALRLGQDNALMTAVVEAMMTNESFFFRDKVPFEHFRNVVMPALIASRRASRSIRIWCAAASTGQEPYSLAMCLRAMEREIAGWRIDILATDLSGEVLEKARLGIYSQFEVQRGLPIQLLIKHFAQVGELWQIAPELRAMVKYRQFNLLGDFTQLGLFDVIFCRNVLIYFDQQTKIDVLNRMARAMTSDGYLVLGAAETVVGLVDSFKVVPEQRGLYAPNARRPLAAVATAVKPGPRLVAVNGGR
jgi:chemotaxis protein methyltransferase CheR